MKSQVAIACLGVWSLLGCQVKLHQVSDAGFAVSAAGTAASGPDAGRLCAQNHACVFGEHWDATQCECARDPQAGASANANAGAGDASTGCVENQLCARGDHWDATKCQCVSDGAGAGGASDAGGASAAGKTGSAGAAGKHAAAGAGGSAGREQAASGDAGHAGGGAAGAAGQGDAGAPLCVQTQACVSGDHWDDLLCKCVAAAADGGGGFACGSDTCTSAQVCCLESGATAGTCARRCDSACPAPCTLPVLDAGTGCKTALDCHGALPRLCRLCDAYSSTDTSPGDGCAHWTCKSGDCQIAYCN